MDLDPAYFDEAIAALRARIPMTDEEFAAVSERLQKRAFVVSNVAQADLVADVWRAIDRAVRDGISFDEWVQELGDDPFAAWTTARLETIFRTNVQQAYSDGRWEQQTDPDVLEARPFWQFDGVEDDRQSEICSALNGVCLPADDPFWQSHNPPLHYNCRSTLISLDEDQAAEQGISAKAPKVKPLDGFGAAPDTGDDWQPDPADYPDAVAQILGRRIAG